MSFRLLATIKFREEAIGGCNEILVRRQVVRGQGRSTRELGHNLGPIPIRERVEFLEQFLSRGGHEIRVPRWILHVKSVGDPEVVLDCRRDYAPAFLNAVEARRFRAPTHAALALYTRRVSPRRPPLTR